MSFNIVIIVHFWTLIFHIGWFSTKENVGWTRSLIVSLFRVHPHTITLWNSKLTSLSHRVLLHQNPVPLLYSLQDRVEKHHLLLVCLLLHYVKRLKKRRLNGFGKVRTTATVDRINEEKVGELVRTWVAWCLVYKDQLCFVPSVCIYDDTDIR